MNFKWASTIAKHQDWLLIGAIILFIVLRVPSLVERHWYSDEGIYAAIGTGLLQGHVLYSSIWDHKPPLLYLLYSLAAMLPNWDYGLFAVRLMSVLFGIGAITVFAKVVRHLINSAVIRFMTIFFFSFLLGIPLLEANIANAEVFFVLFTLGIFYLLLTKQKYWLIGALLFLAFFTKFQAFFEGALVVGAFLALHFPQSLTVTSLKKTIGPMFIGFGIPALLFAGYLWATGSFWAFFESVFLYNFVYVSISDSVKNTFGIAYLGTIIMPAFVIAALGGVFGLAAKKRIGPKTVWVLTLIIAELAATIISGRAYAHYFIQCIPGFALAAGYFLDLMDKRIKVPFFIAVAFFVALYSLLAVAITQQRAFQSYVLPQTYYGNFWQTFVTDTSADPFPWRYGYHIQRDATVSAQLRNQIGPNQSYYLYTEDPWLFALTQRPFTNKYLVWYHVHDVPGRYATLTENAEQADYIIVDNKALFLEDFFAAVPPLKPVATLADFTIYQAK